MQLLSQDRVERTRNTDIDSFLNFKKYHVGLDLLNPAWVPKRPVFAVPVLV